MKGYRIFSMVALVGIFAGNLCAQNVDKCAKDECCLPEGIQVLRVTMAEMPVSKMVSVWNVLTPAQQQALWSQKVEQILSLPWSAEEKVYLEGLKPIVENDALFSTKCNPEENPFLKQVQAYMEEGKERFGWSQNIEYWMFGTLADFPANLIPSAKY